MVTFGRKLEVWGVRGLGQFPSSGSIGTREYKKSSRANFVGEREQCLVADGTELVYINVFAFMVPKSSRR